MALLDSMPGHGGEGGDTVGMTDYDKVVKALQAHIGEHKTCLYCPYISIEGATCMNQMHKDALALIQEQQEQLKAHEWRKFEFREPNAEEKASHPDWVWVLVNAPYEGEEILVSDGEYGWKDEFCDNGVECYLDSGHEMEGCWWMPLPELPKEEDDDQRTGD